MNFDTTTITGRPYEKHRRIAVVSQLARIRIYYTIFCAVILVVVRGHLRVTPGTLLVIVPASLAYSLLRYFKPPKISANRHFPPLIDLLDLLLIAVLVYLTGGISSIFLIAYMLPIGGDIFTFGLKAGLFDYAIAVVITGAMFFITNNVPPLPPLYYFVAGAGTIAFVIWMVGLQAEKEWKLRDEIYLSSVTDQLSGLYNSRYLRARVGEEIARCTRAGKGFALTFIDLDHFKQVNDQHGHLIGDSVLKQYADLLATTIRKSDILARYGGDEFVLLMPETEIEQAEKVMSRIKNTVEKFPFFKNIKISLSYGLSSFPEDGASLDQLLTAADARMYKIKRA